jgi:hypothetical protein
MTALLDFASIKQSHNFRTVLNLSTAAVSDQELDERIHT